MSQRGKRPNPNAIGVDSTTPVKRRKGRPPTVSVDADDFSTPSTSNGGGQHSSSVWQARPHLDLKMSSIYNRSAPEAPAELFRKDLISAMKLPDSEPLSHEEYWVITDQWKQEWERGVQVPVNPDSLPEPIVRSISENYYKGRQDFKLPKNKYIRITKDENFSHDKNYLSNTPAMADSVCSYDLDQLDEAWLKEFNGERALCGLPPVNEEQFERIIEELETRCYDKIQAIMKGEDGLGIEYDENVICDVCRSPDSEEANEMVFCDNCNICVHQACYGITTIPSGQWLCRTCSMGQKPECVLCPNKGGAMKSTRSGQKWAHVSCALWIPEVSIGSVDRMEPITKISSIPQSRWALVCVLCRERVGACIQCSVKTCKTAYHVTCAFQHGLEMRAIIEDENAEDGVKLRSYCQKHSVKKDQPKNSANAEKNSGSASEEEGKVVTNKKKIRKEMTTEERNHARLARLVEIQSEFDKHVSVKDISCHLLDVDQEGINHIYNYWILKRKAGGNDPLLLPKAGDVDVMSQTDQEQADIEKMKMFVHLRQDLERVRNLCYMVSRREKLSRSFFKIREQIFLKQISVLSSCKKSSKQDDDSIKATMEANHAPSIYDVLYSSDSIKDSKTLKIDEMIDSILGNNSSKSKEINGSLKKEKQDAISRYSKLFNGGNISSSSGANKKLNNIYDSLSSESDSSRKPSTRRISHMTSSSISASSASSSEDESATRKSPVKTKAPLPPPSQPVTPSLQPKKKGRPPGSTKQAVAEKRKQMNTVTTKEKKKSLSIDSSSEEDVKPVTKSKLKSPTIPRNRLPTDDVHLTDESDELVPIRNSSGHSIPTTGNAKRILPSAIYSDSDSSSTDKDNKTDHTVSDSQQQPFRTKAAMKEFNINDLLAFDKSKKVTENSESKKSNTQAKKSTSVAPATKKASPLRKDSKSSPIKARRMSTKPTTTLSSDSEVDDDVEISSKPKKSVAPTQKKEILPDFLVVPQREAAKKASENLMKTNSALMVQSISGTASEKNKREVREKLDETVMSSKIPIEVDRDSQKDSKEVKVKATKSSKDSKKPISKEEKVESKRPSKDEKDKPTTEKEEKQQQSDFAADFLPYVPQRQAAKKAAEHIKGLGNSQPVPPVVVEEKAKPPTPTAKKVTTERRKSVAVDLSSSSTSSCSSGSSSSSSSDSESEKESSKSPTKQSTKAPTKSVPSRRPSTAVGPKQKPKDSPFLDKVTKSAVTVKSSSSSSSSDSDSSSSDRPNSSRLPEKGNSSKRRLSEKSQTKKSVAPTSKKSTVKKEIDKQPARRLSTVAKTQLPPASPTKTSTSNRSPQKSSIEPSTAPEPQITSRKRSTSTTTPSKLPSNNKSRAVEPSKGDLAKLPDKRKPSIDVSLKDTEMNPPATKTQDKKRKMSISSPPVKEVVQKESNRKDTEKEKVSNLRRSSRSETLSRAASEKVIDAPVNKTPENQKEENHAVKEKMPVQKDEKVPISSKPKEKVAENKVSSENKPSESKAESFNKETRRTTRKTDAENTVVNMEIDEDLLKNKTINESKLQSPKEIPLKVPTPLSSPMVSIPTANLDYMKPINSEVIEEVFNKVVNEDNIFNTSNSIFSIPKVTDKEAEERETLSLIEKLRKKDKRASTTPTPNIAENNNIVNEKSSENPVKLSPCMHQNENKNTPKHDFLEQQQQLQQQIPQAQSQIPTFKAIGSPSISLSKKDQDFNELKKTSPWNQQHQSAENNYQRSILTSNNNKINSTLEQSPAPASCMVIEQQQKLAASQKINEENNMFSSNRGPNMFMPPMGINHMNEPTNHMDQYFNMQMQHPQQQPSPKWPKDTKSINLKIQDMMKQRNLTGMENMNMINDLNQQAMKNSFPQMPQHKGPMTNDFSSAMHPHPIPENFNSYNFSENASQNTYTGAVSLFPPTDMNVQVPFPSPGQAMFAPNFNNTFTNTPHQSSDPSLMMQGDLQNKVNNSEMMPNNLRFGAQNFCNQTPMQMQQQMPHGIPQNVNNISQNMNHMPMNRSIIEPTKEVPSISEKPESHKKSPSKSTRSSPRNSTPTHGGKTPQKSPSKSPRQPSTPASVESLSRQNSQKGKSTPNANETKQRKSRTNSQASPASTPSEHRGKGRGRTNKNNKTRFPQTNMPFIPFNSGVDYIAINKKLVGTVYDFSADDEFSQAPSVENLRAMRDRTKSVDVFNKLNRDGSSPSPKMTKASIKQSIQQSTLTLNNHLPVDPNALPVAPPIADLNLVNMPGPVDMRTYNSYDSTNDSTYNSQLLGAFASNTVDQTLNDIDEEQEKELQTALKASNDKQKTPTTAEIENTKSSIELTSIVDESVDSEASFAKVSLSDSRNQLKLKIKGPLAHPDLHLHATVNPVIPQNVASSASNASSNRRQMRKKELLQQYWNQDMNVDQEQSNAQTVDHQTTSNISRIGGIPKAVDSMSLGLEEFQDFNYAEYNKKRKLGMSNHSDFSNPSNEIDPLDFNKKRRNRTNRGGQQPNAAVNPPPKLKIKFGPDGPETLGSDLPPKKRLIAAPPSYQDLKRESMNFRKKMMDEFSEQKSKEHRTKEEKREKKEKKKKKKEKKRNEIVAPVKLILKIGNKSVSTVSNASADNSNSSEMNKSAPSLKLKLSRNSQGNGEYNIMNSKEIISTTPTPKSSPGSMVTSTPISSNNNLQPPKIDASDINSITTKKLEISLERLQDVEKAKSLLKKQNEDSVSKDCEDR